MNPSRYGYASALFTFDIGSGSLSELLLAGQAIIKPSFNTNNLYFCHFILVSQKRLALVVSNHGNQITI